jgi:Flp pilus assembly pilin Flp
LSQPTPVLTQRFAIISFFPFSSKLIRKFVLVSPRIADKKWERNNMNKLIQLAVNLQIWKDRKGQDLIEYALMAGFVAVAAGAVMPGIASGINVVFSKVNSIMIVAASS